MKQMSLPLVTVLVDTYNYGRFIEQAIDSVLSQDFPMGRMEILVVDDGSTDDTADRVRKYGGRVQYIYKANGGQASAFNFGFQHANGEIVALLDADDYFLPGKIRRIVEEFQKDPRAGMVYHRLLRLQTSSGDLQELPMVAVSGFLPDDREKLLKYQPYPTSCLAFRSGAVKQLLPVPEAIRLQADTYFTLLAPLVAPIIAISEPLAVYRIHGQNLFFEPKPTQSAESKRRAHGMFITSLNGVEAWVRSHRGDLRTKEADLFLSRWPTRVGTGGVFCRPAGQVALFFRFG